MRPSTYVRTGLRAALRRRYGYAALRVLRRAVGRALAVHLERSVGPGRYAGAGVHAEIASAYWQGLKRLRARWPDLDLLDPRSEP